MSDQIILEGIRVMACVGVPEAERAHPQPLEITVALHLEDLSAAARMEKLSTSVDYAEAHRKIIETVQQRARPLLETVAEDVAQVLLASFRIQRVEVEVRKFVLPSTRAVVIRIARGPAC